MEKHFSLWLFSHVAAFAAGGMERDGGARRAALTRFGGLSVFLMGVAILAVSFSGWEPQPEEKLSPLQVGRYAVRAERQSQDYDEKAERQIAFATDNDNAASGERDLAAKEESRARQSAYLAADLKSRIDKTLEEGRDQVSSAARARAGGALGRPRGAVFARHAGTVEAVRRGGQLPSALATHACRAGDGSGLPARIAWERGSGGARSRTQTKRCSWCQEVR